MTRSLSLLACLLVWASFLGCGSSDTPTSNNTNSGTTDAKRTETSEKTGETTGNKEAAPSGPFQLADLVKPFDPPKLEDMEKTVEWVDRPVIDSLALLREHLAKSEPPLSPAEALKLRNDSPENNDKIVKSLGRLSASDKDVNYGATINRWLPGDVNSTNPILNSTVYETDVNGLTGFGLFSYDWTMTPFAAKDSVVSWQSSKDGLYDKVVMRDDLTWSDGKPITAHDVVFSFKVIMSSQVPVPAVRNGTDKLKWVEAYDDHTLVFFHKESLATNVWNVNFPVIPKHAYENTVAKDPQLTNSPEHVELENKPVAGGAYEIVSRTRGTEIVLKARESYYMHNGKQVRDKPYFETIRFRVREDPTVALFAYKAGDIDEMNLNPEQWRTQTNDDEFYNVGTKVYALEWTSFHFGWNFKTPYFEDKRVRWAMGYAFDHKELLDNFRYGLDQPCTGMFHPASKWSAKPAPKPLQQDLDKAEELLDEAGWVDSDSDGIRDKEVNGTKIPFEFTILVANKPDRIAICTLLKQSLEQIGIRCNISPLEITVLFDKLQKKEFQAFFAGLGTGADPDTSENIWGTNAERNYGSYSNPEVDKLFTEGRKEFDVDKRAKIYQKIHQLTWDDQPYTWLYYQNSYYAFNKKLRGYVFSPRGPYHYGPGFSSIWMPAE
jgi:peptide/nickel transport system substrate-binding protein